MSSSQLTEKTLDVLEAVAALGSPSLPEIQARCGLSSATTYRIMQTLAARGFLMRTGRGHYQLGSAAITLAEGVGFHDLISPAARPHMRMLAKETRSHAHLGVWQDGMVAYLIKQRFGKVRLHTSEGTQLEGYCSALGKVLLSGLTDTDLDNYIDEGLFVAMTPKTIVDRDHLRCEIAAVRERGWATDREEIAPGLRCVAVPLTNPAGAKLAALSVSTVSDRTNRWEPEGFLPALLETAATIRRLLFPHA